MIDPGSLTPAEKMAKMQLEIETLQRELEFKEEIVQRLRFQNSELREKNRFLEIAVEHKDQDRKDVTAGKLLKSKLTLYDIQRLM